MVGGDDKQIHPTYAGVNFVDVSQLRERYITDLPHADAYEETQSFFDLAEIRYKGRIRLREHFRCMREIIQFSNNLSYQGEPLIPLRQYGAGRLEPTIGSRHRPALAAYRPSRCATSGVAAGSPSANSSRNRSFTNSGAPRMYGTYSSSARA